MMKEIIFDSALDKLYSYNDLRITIIGKDDRNDEIYKIKKHAFIGDCHHEFVIYDDNKNLIDITKYYKEMGYMIISAFQEGKSKEENMTAHEELGRDIYFNTKLGFIETVTGYQYEGGVRGTELCCLIPFYSKVITEEEFIKFARDFCKKYHLKSVFVCCSFFNNGKATFIDGEGNSVCDDNKIFFGERVPSSVSSSYIIHDHKKYLNELKR